MWINKRRIASHHAWAYRTPNSEYTIEGVNHRVLLREICRTHAHLPQLALVNNIIPFLNPIVNVLWTVAMFKNFRLLFIIGIIRYNLKTLGNIGFKQPVVSIVILSYYSYFVGLRTDPPIF